MRRVFISCVSDEYSAYRQKLADRMHGAFDVDIQQFFPQSPVDTIEKIFLRVQRANIVIHFVGRTLGSVAAEEEVQAFLATTDGGQFQDFLKKRFSDLSPFRLTYIQWEVLLADFLRVPVLFYRHSIVFSDANEEAQIKKHCELLLRFTPKREAQEFKSFEQLQGDTLISLIDETGIRSERFHRFNLQKEAQHKCLTDELKGLLELDGEALLSDRLLLYLYVQITDAFPDEVSYEWVQDLKLIDRLAERERAQDLLGCVKLCATRARGLGLNGLADELDDWFAETLQAINEHVKGVELKTRAVMGSVVGIAGRLKSGVPALCLEIGFRPKASDLAIVPRFECYIRWGRYRKKAILIDDFQLSLDEVPTQLVQEIMSNPRTHYLPVDRLEIFAPKSLLTNSWEHRFESDNRKHIRQPLSYPTVVRLLDRFDRVVQQPPDPIQRNSVACFWEACQDFISQVCKSGAFFFSTGEAARDSELVHDAVTRVGLGFWLRASHSPDALLQILESLDDTSLKELPRHVHDNRMAAYQANIASAWQDLILLFDYQHDEFFHFEPEGDDRQTAILNDLLQ